MGCSTLTKKRFITSTIGKILVAQLVVIIFASALLLSLGAELASAALIGGLICLLPNVYLACMLTARRTSDPNKLVSTLYTAEIGKIIITVAMFAVVFITQEWVQPGVLMGGYALAQLTHWLTPMFSN